AAAAKCTIAQVREVVNLGDLDPEAVVTPGIFINRVVEIPAAVKMVVQPGAAACSTNAERDMNRFTREQIATRIGCDIPNGAYVNLGIGLPTLVANHLPKDREIILHS